MQFSINKHQQGQALILALFLMLAASGTIVMMYNTGQAAAEKARLVNAADAAAYSGAVYMARNLNYMAYTNRAMIANHIVVGHLVSYVSWLRMIEESPDPLEDIAEALGAIPYVGYILEILLKASAKLTDAFADIAVPVAENFSKGFVPLVEYTNQALHVSQRIASVYMLTGFVPGSPMYRLMNATAREYNDTIKISSIDALKSAASADTAKATQVSIIFAQAASDLNIVYSFLKRYDATSDDGRIKDLTEASYGPSEEWIEERNALYWATIVPLIKTGSTDLTMSDTAEWEAEDNMGIAQGDATASEFMSVGDYTGVPGYYDISEIDSPKNQSLPLTVYATMPFSQARIFRLLGMKETVTEFSTVSRAEVYHKRPEDRSLFNKVKDGEHGEYPNVFNPFWEARLIKNTVIPQFLSNEN